MKQIRLKDKILFINCCESRIHHPEDLQCPIKNNDAHGDGDDGCNLGCDLSGKNIPDGCPLEDVPVILNKMVPDKFVINTGDVQMTEAARKAGVEDIFKQIEERRKREPAPWGRMMKIWLFSWHLIYVFVIAETREEALQKIRAPDSVARKDFPADKYPFVNFEGEPEEEESDPDMLTHFGCD